MKIKKGLNTCFYLWVFQITKLVLHLVFVFRLMFYIIYDIVYTVMFV